MIEQSRSRQLRISKEILDERDSQDAKWGRQDHDPITWMAILTEEVGELAQETLRYRFGGVRDINLKKEAIQVAAVVVAMLECCERNNWLEEPETN
jgi:NTP pyrophosphatase (non-canonical NTP hydrolase)